MKLPPAPTLPRLYGYMTTNHNAYNVIALAQVFKISTSRMYRRLHQLVSMNFVRRKYLERRYYYLASIEEQVMNYDVIFNGLVIQPKAITKQDMYKLLDDKPKKPMKSRLRKLRERLADAILNFVYNIVDIIAPGYYVGFDAW